MANFSTLIKRISAAAAALALVPLAPLAAVAQDLPSYAQPTVISTDETIHGRIRSVDGAFNITVDDDRGFVDSIELHQGTIINPTGLTLSAGMSVTILGTNAGSAFSANEIDTPYTYSGPLPTPVYYGPGYWDPGFAYGYGPSFSLAIVFGGGGYGGWSFAHRPFYGRPWDGHGYFGAAVGYAPAAHDVSHGVRYPTAEHPVTGHVPTAFAGRTFAGESRAAGYRTATSTRAYGDARTYGGVRTSEASRSDARGAGGVRTQTEWSSARGAISRGGGSEHAQGGARGAGGHSH